MAVVSIILTLPLEDDSVSTNTKKIAKIRKLIKGK
jgi:hypothetical protein